MLGPYFLSARGPGAYSGGSGDPGIPEPPVVTVVDGDVTINGKVKPGSFGKFVYPLATLTAGRRYTIRVVATFAQLTRQGALAMVGFGLKNGNDFHICGLRGDGVGGTKEYIVHGTSPNGWNKQTGHTEVDGGAAAAGTQYSAYYRLTVSADGATYSLETDTDATSYSTVFLSQAPTPFTNVNQVTTFGVALWFNNLDTGPFTVQVTEFTDEISPADPYFANVVFLAGFEGSDGATSYSEEKNSRSATFVGNAQLDTAKSKFGSSSLLVDGTGDRIEFADNADWDLSDNNSDQFTIEGWVWFNTLTSANRGIMGQANSTAGQTSWIISGTSAVGELQFVFSVNGTTLQSVTTSGASLAAGAWRAFCIDKDSSGKIRVYIDGAMLGSATPADSTIFNGSVTMTLGAQGSNGAVDMDGWLDEIRITKGVARYASDSGYTPSAIAFPRF